MVPWCCALAARWPCLPACPWPARQSVSNNSVLVNKTMSTAAVSSPFCAGQDKGRTQDLTCTSLFPSFLRARSKRVGWGGRSQGPTHWEISPSPSKSPNLCETGSQNDEFSTSVRRCFDIKRPKTRRFKIHFDVDFDISKERCFHIDGAISGSSILYAYRVSKR